MVPVTLDTAPDQSKPIFAVFMTVESHGALIGQLQQNVMNLASLLSEVVQHLKPNLVAELMTQDLIDPQPHRTALIEGLKSLEEAAAQQRLLIDEMAKLQKQADQENPVS